jgi:hypothetical protein
MGILDEAIREHLELKRQHGADDSELKQLEDQAFGQAVRPGSEESGSDTAAEAPTEFMAQPEVAGEQGEEPAEQPASTRREPAAGMADIQEPPERVEEEQAMEHEDEPAEEEQPAAEHRAIESSPSTPSTEERNAIADQPTEMYDVEEEFTPANSGETSDEELVAEEITEPRLGPADPVAVPGADEKQEDEEDEEDEFFDEKRLSDELDQALEAPSRPETEQEPASEEHEPEPTSEEHEPEPTSEEHEVEHGAVDDEDEDADEDVLEETPDFLEETPEDDELWFEQKPPKDFDFDD